MSLPSDPYRSQLLRRHRFGLLFEWICRLAAWGALALLLLFLAAIVYQARGWVTWDFLWRFNHHQAEKAGMLAALCGSLWLIGISTLLSVPVGVGAAIYLEEYAKPGWLTRQIQLNIANLAGVPSVVYGILGFTIFVRCFGIYDRPQELALSLGFVDIPFRLPFGAVVLAGAGTLTLLSLPTVIIAAQEALRAVPPSLRHASYALGATKWQTIWHQVLPGALPGIFTGLILAMSRAIGETAPLITIGALTYIPFAPTGLDSRFTVLPIQIYNWVSRPQAPFLENAAAGIIVLLLVLLTMNSIAVVLRDRFQKART